MKLAKLTCCTLLLITFFTFSQCKKDKNKNLELPPETNTGAMTFGCKVNGKVFVPQDGNGKPGLFVQYINYGDVPDGGWHLNIPASDFQSNPINGVNIETDSLLLQEGINYEFKTTKGNANAFYQTAFDRGVLVYPKLDNDLGSVFIKKHDKINRILSGTFSFTGTNSNGEKVNITEGRFDIRY